MHNPRRNIRQKPHRAIYRNVILTSKSYRHKYILIVIIENKLTAYVPVHPRCWHTLTLCMYSYFGNYFLPPLHGNQRLQKPKGILLHCQEFSSSQSIGANSDNVHRLLSLKYCIIMILFICTLMPSLMHCVYFTMFP